MKGYMGKVLFVNLTTGEITKEDIPDKVYENLLSGVGLGAYFLYKHIPAGADPLGPDNILGLVSGLLTNSGSLMTGRWMAVCKSPLTGGWGDANGGGTFAPAIKQCGYDAIFFSGISSKPVYLYADDNGAELRDASHVWGKDAVEAEDILRQECKTKKRPQVAVIGQAGENKSLIAGISNSHGRIAARSGVGAVMGSKLLKAVVLNGSKQVEVQDREALKAHGKEFAEKVKNAKIPKFLKGFLFPLVGLLTSKSKKASAVDGMMSTMLMKDVGTISNNTMGLPNGDTPVKNWGGSKKDFKWKKYKKLNHDLILARETRKYRCHSCVIGCGGICDIGDVRDGKYTHTHKPEYETCASFGALLMLDDLEAILYINEMLNRAGMDSISAGTSVAFAIECFEKGIITEKDTGGIILKWGDADTIIALLEKMILRQDIGDILADGVKAASQKIGKNSQQHAVHVGGQEPGMHDPKMDPMLGVHFSADPAPGKHTVGGSMYYNMLYLWEEVSWAPAVVKYPKAEEYTPSDKDAIKSTGTACYKMLTDGSGGCFFGMITGVIHWNLFKMLNSATGWNLSADEYMVIGRRMQTLRQMFNIKHGIQPKDFIMTGRVPGRPPLKTGALKGITLPVEEMVSLHWKHFGWNENTGSPEDGTIKDLHLKELLA
ncbi:MAG: aldehyde ferredoxin oxidoreductase [Deltaproteobacteria bacterium]|nr:aldehyde ferredoxin oxidoreductase [Deltaproteobacteria bacterium]